MALTWAQPAGDGEVGWGQAQREMRVRIWRPDWCGGGNQSVPRLGTVMLRTSRWETLVWVCEHKALNCTSCGGGVSLTLKNRCLHGPKNKEMLARAYVRTQSDRRAYPTLGRSGGGMSEGEPHVCPVHTSAV